MIRDRNFDKVQKHLSNTSHFFDFIVLFASKRRFEALSPVQRAQVKAAAEKAAIAQRTAAAAADAGAIVELGNRGIQSSRCGLVPRCHAQSHGRDAGPGAPKGGAELWTPR